MAEKVSILKTNVSTYNLQETMAEFEKAIADQHIKLRVAVTPVNCILWARKNRKLQNIYNSADIVTADGVPVVWASKWLKKPIKGRVTGLDLLPAFAKTAAEKGYSFYFLGAAEGVGEQLAQKLKAENSGLQIAGVYSPPFADRFTDDENELMIQNINSSGADVLWVSLTAPKQDYWIAEHFDRLEVSVAIGVGAAFDVVAGNIKRAPGWMQKYGLEWFYRLLKEPKRLASRYLVEAPQFIPLIIKQVVTERRTKR